MKQHIIYEDEYLIALNKPTGWLCHPVGNYQGDSIVSQMEYYYNNDVKILHRLDKNTSGVILLARDPRVVPKMYKQFFHRTIRKSYLAIVHGQVQQKSDKITFPIANAKKGLIQLKMEINLDDGQPSETYYECLAKQDKYSLLLVKPVTGRKHQIRIHLATIGYPIVGDYLYNKSGLPFLWEYYLKNPSPWHENITGQALHAHSITFTHPVHEKEMSIIAPPPPYFQEIFGSNVVENLGLY